MVDGTSGSHDAAAEAEPTATSGRRASRSARWPMSLLGLGIVLFLLSIGGWWAQDAIGTVVNAGEADIGETVTFTADGGRYRLLSSGPLRPAAESTWCDLTYADGSTRREVGGQGLQAGRLGVDRLLNFTPPEGETSVRCTSRGSSTTGNGRFQVLQADGPVRLALIGTISAALISLAVGIAGTLRAVRSSAGLDVGSFAPSGVFGHREAPEDGSGPTMGAK